MKKKFIEKFHYRFFFSELSLIGGDGGGRNYMNIMNYYGWKLDSEVNFFFMCWFHMLSTKCNNLLTMYDLKEYHELTH